MKRSISEELSLCRAGKRSNFMVANRSLYEMAATDDLFAKAEFKPTEPVPNFCWKPPTNIKRSTPANTSDTFCDLLIDNAYIDKSAALFSLLKDTFNKHKHDFESVPLLVAYPRRFAKTTLLGFIEAIFSPLPELENYLLAEVKTRVAALERGKELLELGLHPVLRLDLHKISSVDKLNVHIQRQLEFSGLKNVAFEATLSPADRVLMGVKLLNQKFKDEMGVKSSTIVLIDEYDKPFRNAGATDASSLLGELIELFSLGKVNKSGISLLVLCGLTRMVGTGLSQLNNLLDVSRMSIYHGLCGISSRELIRCADGQLDEMAKKKYGNKNFKDVLDNVFRREWDGFRFGLDKQYGELDPESSDGVLFSPIDAWEVVRSLYNEDDKPSSPWMATMNAEFEFTNFSAKYTCSQEGASELYLNLQGGWVDKASLTKQMKRDDYMTLAENLHVKKVLFELGLLSVKEIDGELIRLGYPNWRVAQKAMQLLVAQIKPAATSREVAEKYLSKAGFEAILSKAAKEVTNLYGRSVVHECPLQDLLYMQLLICFPDNEDCTDYKLYKNNCNGSELIPGIAVALLYENGPKMAFIVEMKHAMLTDADPESIKEAHEENIAAATAQVQCNVWQGPEVEMVRRVAVSGVWFRSSDAVHCTMQYTFKFLKPITERFRSFLPVTLGR